MKILAAAALILSFGVASATACPFMGPKPETTESEKPNPTT